MQQVQVTLFAINTGTEYSCMVLSVEKQETKKACGGAMSS